MHARDDRFEERQFIQDARRLIRPQIDRRSPAIRMGISNIAVNETWSIFRFSLPYRLAASCNRGQSASLKRTTPPSFTRLVVYSFRILQHLRLPCPSQACSGSLCMLRFCQMWCSMFEQIKSYVIPEWCWRGRPVMDLGAGHENLSPPGQL